MLGVDKSMDYKKAFCIEHAAIRCTYCFVLDDLSGTFGFSVPKKVELKISYLLCQVRGLSASFLLGSAVVCVCRPYTA